MNIKMKAKEYATMAHEGQFRKTENTPMIVHPIRVAKMLEEAGFPDFVVAAGYLHDTVEDTEVTLEDIINEFGLDTAFVVESNTEDKSKCWEDRKQHTIDSIKNQPLYAKALVVADKLDNLRSVKESLNHIGDEVWSKFKRGKSSQFWYFSGVAKNMYENLTEDEIPGYFYEYENLVKEVFDEFFK